MNQRPSSAQQRQKQIYLAGLAGKKPPVPVDMAELERRALRRMSRDAAAAIGGGAGREDTMQANREAFARWQILPRILRDVSALDTSLELFGQRLPAPLLLAPVGGLGLVHKGADVAAARAAAKEGIPMIFSSQASRPMEACAAVMGASPRWFQLYWSQSDELTASFLSRAEACGCSAIVLTLDTTLLGWRTRDLDCGYLPFLHGQGLAQYTSDPVFQALCEQPLPADEAAPPRTVNLSTLRVLVEVMRTHPGSFWGNLFSGKPLQAMRHFIRIFSRPSLSWEDLPFLRRHTRLPLLLKGILHPDDARKARDLGIDGIIVSNHGGRQLDGAIGALSALPEVVKAVDGAMPVLFDSGIRGGADSFKALALGARAVCIGRPYVYGLALAGETGVREVLQNLRADFEITMGLAGCRHIGEITPETLVPA